MPEDHRNVREGPAPVALAPHVAERLDKLDRRIAALVDLLTARERTVRYQFTGNTDGSGNATLEVRMSLAEGYEFALHRLIVDDATGTFSSTTTGGSFEIQVNGQRVDGESLGTVGLPAVWTAGSASGVFIRGGDKLEVVLVACGAHSKRVLGLAQGKLRRIPLGE